MKCAILGGSFNPPHIGHLLLCEAVAEQFSCDMILLVPSYVSAHKTYSGNAKPGDRLRMARLAARGNGRIRVEDCEIRRGGVSYSIDTVLEIKRKYGLTDKPGLVVGDDLIDNFQSWKDWRRLCDEASIILAQRQTDGGVHPRAKAGFSHLEVENLLVPVSSSDIRERIRSGRSFRYLVTDSVYSYIMRRGLYAD